MSIILEIDENGGFRHAPTANQTFIYFLRAGEFVKIGQSRRWKSRMSGMQTGSPYTIVPLLILIADEKMEKQLHRRFKADHFRGEWFHIGPAVRAFIKENKKNCVAKSARDDLSLAASWDDLPRREIVL